MFLFIFLFFYPCSINRIEGLSVFFVSMEYNPSGLSIHFRFFFLLEDVLDYTLNKALGGNEFSSVLHDKCG